jgi:phosphoglycerol transferase MdoB-like AlkP superfamily enzyme
MIVATGDHNTLALFNFTDHTLLQKLSVPLVIYIPEKYRRGIYNPQRFGSHKDIFPTIFNLALSKTTYLKTGNNMFSSDKTTDFFSLNDGTVGMNQYGCVMMSEKPLFYTWVSGGKSLEPLIFTHPRELDDLAKKIKSTDAAITYYIQKQMVK